MNETNRRKPIVKSKKQSDRQAEKVCVCDAVSDVISYCVINHCLKTYWIWVQCERDVTAMSWTFQYHTRSLKRIINSVYGCFVRVFITRKQMAVLIQCYEANVSYRKRIEIQSDTRILENRVIVFDLITNTKLWTSWHMYLHQDLYTIPRSALFEL